MIKIISIVILITSFVYSKQNDLNTTDNIKSQVLEKKIIENLIVVDKKYTLFKGISFNRDKNLAIKEAQDVMYKLLALYLGFEVIYKKTISYHENLPTLLDEYISDDPDDDERKIFLNNKVIKNIFYEKNDYNNKEILAVRTLVSYIKPVQIKIDIKENPYYLMYKMIILNTDIETYKNEFRKRYIEKMEIIKTTD